MFHLEKDLFYRGLPHHGTSVGIADNNVSGLLLSNSYSGLGLEFDFTFAKEEEEEQ